MNETMDVFAPRASRGSLMLLAVGLGVLAVSGAVFVAGRTEAPVLVLAVNLLLGVGGGLYMVLLAASMPAMRYELDGDTLHLRCGPLLHYRVPIDAITKIERRDLTPSMWASLRLPGVALYTVGYSDAGRIRMCATRAAEGILLVVADGRTYGLTPADEDGFLTAMRARLPSK